MASTKITEAALREFGPAKRPDGTLVDAFLWDSELAGFGVKATRGGRKVFIAQYRIGGRAGKTQRLTLGVHGAVTLHEARQAAKQALGKAAAKTDPAEEVREDKRTKGRERAAGTLREVIESFLEKHEKDDGRRYWKAKRARLLSSDLVGLHKRPITSIKRADIARVIGDVRVRSHAVARLLFADLRPLFKWARDLDIIEANPMAELRGPKPPVARERVLEDFEIRAFWQAASDGTWPFASIYKLLLMTGTRRDEVASLRWEELFLDEALWIIPGSRTKNRREHRVHLVPDAVALLDVRAVDAIKRAKGFPSESNFVFSTTGVTAPSGFGRSKQALDERMRVILGPKFKPWRVHDLRRTCATKMEDLGIETRVIEAALNHVSGSKAGIVGVYQRSKHEAKVKAAFDLWGRHLARLVSGEETAPAKVVHLQDRKAS